MRTHVAFLRAINVGGRRLTMDELTAAFGSVGVDDVATWQATGNVALTADGRATVASLQRRIETTLGEQLGYEVPTVVRTAADVRTIAGHEPFAPAELEPTLGKVQVVFVKDGEPEAGLRDEVAAAAEGLDDLLVWAHDVLFWLPREGISTSSLPIGRLGDRMGVATVRTQRSVAGLAAKLL